MFHYEKAWQDVRSRIARAAHASRRDPDAVRLVAVSKTFPAEAVRAVHALGQHPAILVQRLQPAIDPNTFIVAHPARLMLVATQCDRWSWQTVPGWPGKVVWATLQA